MSENIDQLLANHRTGYSLARAFYVDDEVFEAEFEHLFGRKWQYVDHIERIPNKGDWFLFRIAGEEIIIVRGDGDTVYAHFNVCRHRGSRICLESEGSSKRLTCPYHAWSYRIDGSLAAARAMGDGFEPADFGLRSCQVRLFEGLIFINLAPLTADFAPDFDTVVTALKPWLERADLRQTKIAFHETYRSAVNWKIAIENYFECYHCVVSHPELTRVQLHTLRDAVATDKAVETWRTHNKAWQKEAVALGHKIGGFSSGSGLPDAENYAAQMHYAERMLIHHDLDAAYAKLGREKPLTPKKLLGSYSADDNGQVDWGIMPSVFCYTSCTSTVIFRITPIGPLETEMAQTWLVHQDAVEGEDYDVESLTWLDRVTQAQDEKIVADTQAGVLSRAYTPGPYSELEGYIHTIHDDYIRALKFGQQQAETG